MGVVWVLIYKIINKIIYISHSLWMFLEKKQLGACGKNVIIKYPNKLNNRMFIGNDVNIYEYGLFLIGPGGRFVMKSHSGASQRLTVITGNHGHKVGILNKIVTMNRLADKETTITVEEDVRIGANVTLLPGVTLGRGCRIGACSVVTKNIPPYAIAAGNPAKVIRFIFTPEEIIQHERKLYEEQDRLEYNKITEYQKTYKQE